MGSGVESDRAPIEALAKHFAIHDHTHLEEIPRVSFGDDDDSRKNRIHLTSPFEAVTSEGLGTIRLHARPEFLLSFYKCPSESCYLRLFMMSEADRDPLGLLFFGLPLGGLLRPTRHLLLAQRRWLPQLHWLHWLRRWGNHCRWFRASGTRLRRSRHRRKHGDSGDAVG